MLCTQCLHRETCAISNFYQDVFKNSELERWIDDIELNLTDCKYFLYDLTLEKYYNNIMDSEIEKYALTQNEYEKSIDILIKEVEEICSCRCGMRNFYKQTERYDWI